MNTFEKKANFLRFFIKSWGVALLLFSAVVYAEEVTVLIKPQQNSVKEGGAVTIDVTASGSAGCNVGIKTSSRGTALNNKDYIISAVNIFTESVSASDAIGSGSLTFKAIADAVVEPTPEKAILTPDVKPPCTLSPDSTRQVVITILDGTVATNSLRVSFNSLEEKVQKGGGDTNIAEVKFNLRSNQLPDNRCKAVATVKVVGGTAQPGVDFNFTPTRINYGRGDRKSKTEVIHLDVLEGIARSGNKTVKLEATFSSIGVKGKNSCPLVNQKPQKLTVILLEKDNGIAPPIEAKVDKPEARRGESVKITFEAEGNIESCGAITPKILPETTADPKHYQLSGSTVKVLGQDINKETQVVVGGEIENCPNIAIKPVSFKILKRLATNNLTASFNLREKEVQKGGGDTNIAEVKFNLRSNQLPDNRCKAVATVKVVGGTAQPGVDFNFTPTRINYGRGDRKSKTEVIHLDVLEGIARSGNKTVKLEATFSSIGVNGKNSCPLVDQNPRQLTVILLEKDNGIETPISAKVDKPLARRGESVKITFEAEGNIESCGAITPKILPETTADPKHYQLSGSTVKVLGQDINKETQVVVGGETENCPDIIIEPVTFKIPKRLGTNSNSVNHTADVRLSICKDLQDKLKKKSNLTKDEQSFLDSTCKTDSDPKRLYEAEEVSAQTRALIGGADRQLRNIRSRLQTLRATKGARGVDVSSANLNIQGSTISVGLLGGAAGDDENSLLANSRWGFFANGDYAFGNERNKKESIIKTGGDRDLDFNSTGLTFGVDYRFPNEKLFTGIALGYKDFDSDFTTQSGKTTLKGYTLGAYGTYLPSNNAYLETTIGFGNNKLKSSRPVGNDGSGGIGKRETFAIGKPDATELIFSVGGGYELNKGAWSLTPYGRMDYTKGTIDAYTEIASHSSARTQTLQINKQNIESLTSTLGLKTTHVLSTSNGVFVPYASVEWKHEFKERGTIAGTAFGGRAYVQGNRTQFDKDYYNLGIGVSAQFPKGKSAFVSFESRQGDSIVKDNAVRAGIRLEF